MDVEQRTVAAALRIVARSSVGDVLSLLTIEGLRNEMMGDDHGQPPTSRTIAQAFAGPNATAGFSRPALVEAMIAHAVDKMVEVAGVHAAGYLQAVDTVTRGGGPEAFIAAITRDMRDNQPGGDGGIDERERIFHIAIAMSDDEPRLARQLRRFIDRHAEVYAEPLAALGKLFNRRLATGVTDEQLHLALNGYARGVQLYLRCGAVVDPDAVAATIVRIYWAHTTSVTTSERNPVQELWSGVNHAAVRREKAARL